MRDLLAVCVIAAAALAGCSQAPGQAAAVVAAVEPGADDVGYYCSMSVLHHAGPKGQAHVSGRQRPLWFTSVRDLLAFTRLPGEPKNIAALYVNDMGRATWESPEPGTWIDARTALYVVGSALTGGMGAAEVVPFGRREAAEAFAARNGGEVLDFVAIPDAAVLGAVTGASTARAPAPSKAQPAVTLLATVEREAVRRAGEATTEHASEGRR